jgi:hypothetical protein
MPRVSWRPHMAQRCSNDNTDFGVKWNRMAASRSGRELPILILIVSCNGPHVNDQSNLLSNHRPKPAAHLRRSSPTLVHSPSRPNAQRSDSNKSQYVLRSQEPGNPPTLVLPPSLLPPIPESRHPSPIPTLNLIIRNHTPGLS